MIPVLLTLTQRLLSRHGGPVGPLGIMQGDGQPVATIGKTATKAIGGVAKVGTMAGVAQVGIIMKAVVPTPLTMIVGGQATASDSVWNPRHILVTVEESCRRFSWEWHCFLCVAGVACGIFHSSVDSDFRQFHTF